MKITKEFLEEHNACQEGVEWVTDNHLIGLEDVDFLEKLVDAKKYDWANWLIVRVMKKPQCLSYAIFAARQVLHIFEEKYPNDNRPRKAIEAAEKYLKNPTKKNKDAADDAAEAASDDADDAAFAASYAALASDDADDATYDAALAATVAARAAYYAARASRVAFAAEKEKMRTEMLNYGIELLKGEGK